MKHVYVVTDTPSPRARAIRGAVYLIAARIVAVLAWTGHAIAQSVGAVDAIVSAWLGVPRGAVLARRVRAALRETWEA